MAGYALLGATWLIMKTEGPVAARARAQAKALLLVVIGFMAPLLTLLALDYPSFLKLLKSDAKQAP